MKKILIATPAYDGKLGVQYSNSITDTIRLGLLNNIFIQPVYLPYEALLEKARNHLLKIAFDSEVESVIWIDSDMEWDAEWVLKFIESDYDVLGAPCPKKSSEEAYNVKCKLENLVADDEGFIQVESVGTGFLKMSKRAIRYLWENSESYTDNDVEYKRAFEVKVIDGSLYSEDTVICKKLIDGGFSIMLDSSITLSHIGHMTFSGNFKEFIDKVKNTKL
jgi:hypothetical protein